MSGHSKWATTKNQKALVDAKRGAIFTKLGHNISIAAREGGGDPVANFKLRLAIDKAKQANMPKDNIERAIKRGTGELGGERIEEIVYEGFGPEGVALVIETVTDNKNRTVSNIRHILNKCGGSLGGANSTAWMFEKRGIIKVQSSKLKVKSYEEFELKLIDMGAEDIQKTDDELTIYTKPEDLQKIKDGLEKEGIAVDYAEMELIAKEKIKVERPELKEKLENMFSALDENEDISNYYSNVEE